MMTDHKHYKKKCRYDRRQAYYLLFFSGPASHHANDFLGHIWILLQRVHAGSTAFCIQGVRCHLLASVSLGAVSRW